MSSKTYRAEHLEDIADFCIAQNCNNNQEVLNCLSRLKKDKLIHFPFNVKKCANMY